MVPLGARCRDSISGWEGVAAGRYEYLNGCVRIGIAGVDKDGKPEEFSFDEPQVIVLDVRDKRLPSEIAPSSRPMAAVGGPRGTTPPPRR